MNKIRLKVPSVGFYFLALALIVAVAAFVTSFKVYGIFGYHTNRWVVFTSFAAIWLLAFFIVNTLFAGEKPFWTMPLFAAVCALLVFAAVLFIQPCLSPIGVYFTVHNMGDVEVNALGVPRAIVTTVLYVVALVLTLIASFCPLTVKEKGGESL